MSWWSTWLSRRVEEDEDRKELHRKLDEAARTAIGRRAGSGEDGLETDAELRDRIKRELEGS